MKSLVLFAALCAVTQATWVNHGVSGLVGVGAVGYAGGWAHGAAPLGPGGVVVDTPEVAAAKSEHLHAVAAARSGAAGAWNGAAGAWNGAGVWNGLGAVGIGAVGLGAVGLGAVHDNGQWNGDNGAVWVGRDNGQWNGDNGAVWAGRDNGQWNGDSGAVWAGRDNGQWNGDNGAVWAGHDNGQWHGEGVLDGAAFRGAGGALGVYAAGHSGLNNGQWSAHLWGDRSGHGRWRRHAVLAAPLALPVAHSAIVAAPAVTAVAPVAVAAPAVAIGHSGLGLGLGYGYGGLLHG